MAQYANIGGGTVTIRGTTTLADLQFDITVGAGAVLLIENTTSGVQAYNIINNTQGYILYVGRSDATTSRSTPVYFRNSILFDAEPGVQLYAVAGADPVFPGPSVTEIDVRVFRGGL